jgi:hypothetical protein
LKLELDLRDDFLKRGERNSSKEFEDEGARGKFSENCKMA